MDLYKSGHGAQTRWASFENPTAARGSGGMTNRGAKGRPCLPLLAGETLTLLDSAGSGLVTRIWLTLRDRSPEMLRGIVIRMYWDGEKRPAVNCPIGDFFGVGLGRRLPFESGLFSDPEGRSFNCAIPMPFRSHARITLTNETPRANGMLFYDVDFLLDVPHADDVLYFHAAWRRESPNALAQDFTILPEVKGNGRFLGCNLGVITSPVYTTSWWGEGEVKVWLDGDGAFPTLCGTGTEDYIGDAWGQKTYAHRSQGCLVADGANRHWAFYRYHIDDPVFFSQSCRVAIQTIGGDTRGRVAELLRAQAPLKPVTVSKEGLDPMLLMDTPEAAPDFLAPVSPNDWVNFFRQDDWSGTAYFYLDRPANDLPALAPLADRTAGLVAIGSGTARADT